MALSPQWLDELRTRISLSGVIRRTVKLQRAGNEWKACCPFHDEKTPSFYINDAKGFYHCFGCGAHGDAIRWLTDQRGLEFIDAVKELAGEAGLEMPAPDPAFAAQTQRRAEQRAGLHEVLQAAQDWFAGNLGGADGRTARDYLAARGIAGRTVERFGFGWAPDGRGSLKQALGHFGEDLLVEAGLLVDPEPDAANRTAQPRYDRFRGRIMLPIHDVRGRVIAFGGRILDTGSKAPKYLNSPDSPVFDKSRVLYNMHRAGPASRKTGRLVVVEGYMDVVALAQAGIEDAVAPMGTALTEQQLALLWRLVDKPVLCFDGDDAGQRAGMRAVGRALPLLQPGKSLDFVRLPSGLDPDDLIRRDGAAAMDELLAEPTALLEMVWSHESAALPLATPEDKAGLKARLLAQVDAITDTDIRALYRRDLLDRFSAFAFPPRGPQPARAAQRPWQPGGRRWQPSPARLASEGTAQLRRAVTGGARDHFTQAVLAGLARYPQAIDRHAEALLQLAAADPHLAQPIDLLLSHCDLLELQTGRKSRPERDMRSPDEPGSDPDAQTLEASSQSPISPAGTLAPPPGNIHFSFLAEGHDPESACEDLAEAISLLVERPALDAAIARATARFSADPEGAFGEQQRLRKRKLEIDSRIGHLARKRAAQGELESTQPGYDFADGAYPSDNDMKMELNKADGNRS